MFKSKLKNLRTDEERTVTAPSKKEVIALENDIKNSTEQINQPGFKTGDNLAWEVVERVVVVDEYRSAPRGNPLKPGRDMPKIERKGK